MTYYYGVVKQYAGINMHSNEEEAPSSRKLYEIRYNYLCIQIIRDINLHDNRFIEKKVMQRSNDKSKLLGMLKLSGKNIH